MTRENTKSGWLFGRFKEMIQSGSYRYGDKLPSLRELAETEGVSKSTAVEVYERLSAVGLVEPMPGRGFFVSRRDTKPMNVEGMKPITSPISVSDRQWLRSVDANGLLASGAVNPTLLDEGLMRASIRKVASRPPESLLAYGEMQGHRPLRAAISERLRAIKVEIDPDRIMITDSASQAIDLICRSMLTKTDVILVDDPTSFEFAAFSRLYGTRVIGLPIRSGERDLEALNEILKVNRPKLYLTNTVLQNPTGITLGSRAAFRLLSILKSHDVTVIEDDVYADLDTEAAVRLASLSQFENVVYVSSFSKTMSGSLRCGFVAASAGRIRSILDLSNSSNYGSSSISARIVYEVLISGKHRRSIVSLCEKVALLRNRALSDLLKLGFEINPPPGGIFLWGKCPAGVDARALALKAIERDLLLAPGSLFSPNGNFNDYIRFNCTYMDDPKIVERLNAAVMSCQST